jgi:hypothetical protein
MKVVQCRWACAFLLCLFSHIVSAQVKPAYLYNTNMPYGTLDLRIKISATNYFFLSEGKTFNFRESSPGVKSNTFLDMTSWDSSPYNEGHMRHRDGSSERFIMNYRLLHPTNYNATHKGGYPMIVLMHGAVERGNCYYDNCYHGDWNYDPNVNSPPAPVNAGHQLLNNDHHLLNGGREHLAARNLASNYLPGDPALPARAFPGFVLFPQMFNAWDSVRVEDMIKLVLLHVEKYNINPDQIYIHGLSIGGYATYEAIKRAPWLFAAALPMSAVTEAANIFAHNQQKRVAHIPLWAFQGALDTKPTPEFTKQLMQKFKNAGSRIRYAEYADRSHNVWAPAYSEPEFFSWMLKQKKSSIHPLFERTKIEPEKNLFPELVLAEGFLAYQWEKDGNIIQGASNHALIVKEPGTYRARFSRKSGSPSENQWNPWSTAVVITSTSNNSDENDEEEEEEEEEDQDDDDSGDDGNEDDDDGDITATPVDQIFSVSVFPNPSRTGEVFVLFSGDIEESPMSFVLLNAMGQAVSEGILSPSVGSPVPVPSDELPNGVYMLILDSGKDQHLNRLIIRK